MTRWRAETSLAKASAVAATRDRLVNELEQWPGTVRPGRRLSAAAAMSQPIGRSTMIDSRPPREQFGMHPAVEIDLRIDRICAAHPWRPSALESVCTRVTNLLPRRSSSGSSSHRASSPQSGSGTLQPPWSCSSPGSLPRLRTRLGLCTRAPTCSPAKPLDRGSDHPGRWMMASAARAGSRSSSTRDRPVRGRCPQSTTRAGGRARSPSSRPSRRQMKAASRGSQPETPHR
jgi:hypothetical protein